MLECESVRVRESGTWNVGCEMQDVGSCLRFGLVDSLDSLDSLDSAAKTFRQAQGGQ